MGEDNEHHFALSGGEVPVGPVGVHAWLLGYRSPNTTLNFRYTLSFFSFTSFFYFFIFFIIHLFLFYFSLFSPFFRLLLYFFFYFFFPSFVSLSDTIIDPKIFQPPSHPPLMDVMALLF